MINFNDRKGGQKDIFERGDIVLINLGKENIEGSEQRGVRPAIIVQNNTGNKFSPTIVVSVITSKLNKAKLPTHVEISTKYGLEKDSITLLEQIKTIDKKRVIKKIGKLDSNKLNEVDEALRVSLGLIQLSREIKLCDELEKEAIYIRKIDNAIEINTILNKSISDLIQIRTLKIMKLKEKCIKNKIDMKEYYYKEDKEILIAR